ncbi:MAG: transposase [Candidatus Thermoplasmatota archaeon]|nr:transposase [Candidatus Thermoplasmatota archaeon]
MPIWAAYAGTFAVQIDPKYTSRECPQCGNIKHDLKLTDDTYLCHECCLSIDRDVDAAKNTERRGIEKLKNLQR